MSVEVPSATVFCGAASPRASTTTPLPEYIHIHAIKHILYKFINILECINP
jgi:hypothetical protein